MDELKFDSNGLITAVVQDAGTKDVLMVAWMNAEALQRTRESGETWFWSRSRKKLWFKGESSGHTQRVLQWFVDCDADALLFEVDQEGGACHTGYASCFFQALSRDGSPEPIAEKTVFDPEQTYSK